MPGIDEEAFRQISGAVDRDRLTATACDLVAIPSFTGDEEAIASHLRGIFEQLGLVTTWQQVETGRANVVGTLEGRGSGASLMLNGHLDTSYSGSESWLDGPGFKPVPLVRDDMILGLGIMNMKGSIACYVEAVRALKDAGVTLSGDLVVAAVAGEIEKAQWGQFVGAEFRGYGAGTRHLVAHGVVTDACILGEPTEERIVLGHWGTMWARISTSGPFFHTAFSQGRIAENAIARASEIVRALIDWIPEWEKRSAYQGQAGAANIGAIQGGFPWRVSRTPHRADIFCDLRIPPTMPMTAAKREFHALVRDLASKFPDYGVEGEVFVTAPGAEIDEDHPLVSAVDRSHSRVHGAPAERDYVRWASDASTLVRYGIAALNYGPISSALPGPEGESVPIKSLVDTATSYAITAADYCGVIS